MRKLCVALGLVMALAVSARAQGVEVFGGYSFTRVQQQVLVNTCPPCAFPPAFAGSDANVNINGWEGSVNFKPIRWLGGVADFAGDYGSAAGIGTNLHTFLFGPQLSFPAPVSPFVHALFGEARVSAGGESDRSFASAIGGGIDVKAAHFLAFRLIQGDYIATHFAGKVQNEPRVSAGIVLRF